MKKQEIKEKEKQHAEGYARKPSHPDEFAEWEGEQVWLEDEPFEHEEAIQQTATIGEGTNAMKPSKKQQKFARSSKDGTTATVLSLSRRIVNDEMQCPRFQSMISLMAEISG